MCEYCEKVRQHTGSYIDYVYKDGEGYISYDKETNDFSVWDRDNNCLVVITHCPWCGRKLEAPKEEFVPVLSDKQLIAELMRDRDKMKEQLQKQQT